MGRACPRHVHLNPVRAKGDKGKVAVAVRLRRETTMTVEWVAQRLAMGSWSYVSNLLAAVQKQAR